MDMQALADFGQVNRTGFRKALKKHDKARSGAGVGFHRGLSWAGRHCVVRYQAIGRWGFDRCIVCNHANQSMRLPQDE